MDATSSENKPPILHILVVGFHHKLGCQVEFSYPPLVHGSSGRNECPSGWKYLSTLALPDGSHNFTEDTVFFNLPSLTDPTESIYGVSCYRQIAVEKLKIRTADVTRSTVQKSVCCLARLPIYGYIEVKLSLIADAFFEEGDFSSTDLLVKAYQQLNACLLDRDESRRPLRHFYVGISLREIVLHWRHKTLQLLKLFLLQRRVVCFGSPVRGMCSLILGISSLIPRLLEKGFQEVACVRTSRPLSPMPDYSDSLIKVQDCNNPSEKCENSKFEKVKEEGDSVHDVNVISVRNVYDAAINSKMENDNTPSGRAEELGDESMSSEADCVEKRMERSGSFVKESSLDASTSLDALIMVNPDEYRAPISIFASGNLCLPYLSLPYIDLLTDPSVMSYVIGTSNVLFQQRNHLADVLVDIENGNFDCRDPELRKQLVLSTEDLRFMDYLLKHVQVPKEDAEGSEVWIRQQFQGYILSLLRTAVLAMSPEALVTKDMDHFNLNYMNAFQKTQCYQEWYDVRPNTLFFESLPGGHPFAGNLSVADMKLKITQTMQNSESGRKINQAVNTTSRAVGGAITQAKGAFSYWWSSITTSPASGTSDASESRSTASDPLTQTQDITLSFQNIDKIDAGISVHTDENVVFCKQFEGEHEIFSQDAGKNISDSVEDLVEVVGKLPNETERRGIVEIGREAEVLNTEENTISGNSASCSSGSIFIV